VKSSGRRKWVTKKEIRRLPLAVSRKTLAVPPNKKEGGLPSGKAYGEVVLTANSKFPSGAPMRTVCLKKGKYVREASGSPKRVTVSQLKRTHTILAREERIVVYVCRGSAVISEGKREESAKRHIVNRRLVRRGSLFPLTEGGVRH